MVRVRDLLKRMLLKKASATAHLTLHLVSPLLAAYCWRMIKLQSGRTIFLEKLHQEQTYAGMLEGTPRKALNDRTIARWQKQILEHEGDRGVLIEPVRRTIPSGLAGNEMFGPAEVLPDIVCVGLFHSSPVRNEPEHFSLLSILWFQDDFALPIEPSVVEQIRKLDWENLAYNWTL